MTHLHSDMGSVLEALAASGINGMALLHIAFGVVICWIAWNIRSLIATANERMITLEQQHQAHAEQDRLQFESIDGDLKDAKETFRDIRKSISKLHDRINEHA